jgi:molecular chaperone IbpA
MRKGAPTASRADQRGKKIQRGLETLFSLHQFVARRERQSRASRALTLVWREEDFAMSYDFTPLYRSNVGFDRLFESFDRQMNGDPAPGWPPYNIEKLADDAYRISLVVAGFAPSDIELTQHENDLIVSGRKMGAEEGSQFLHHGISSRPFKQSFNLAQHVKVVEATQENGVLTITLKREIPEALKPRRIAINNVATSQIASQDNRAEAERVSRQHSAA